jgi:hypothetical protein
MIETRVIKDELVANTERSVEHLILGSPTFYVRDEIYFGKDRMRDVKSMIVRARAGTSIAAAGGRRPAAILDPGNFLPGQLLRNILRRSGSPEA